MSKREEPDGKNVNKSDNEVDISEAKIEGDNNSIGTVEQKIENESPEIPLQNDEHYNGFLALYRVLCENIPNKYETPIFGLSGILGLLAFGFKVYTGSALNTAIFFDWMYWGGGLLAVYGIGYFFVGGNCENCGSRFALTNTQTHEIDRQERTGKSDRVQIRKVYRCEECHEEEVKTYWDNDE